LLAALNELTAWVNREIFLAEVFLWKTPLDCAFWISGIVFSRAFWAPSASFFSMAAVTVLIEDFTVVLMWRLRSLLFSACLALFIADRWVAKI
jgi:hypothetical protein